MQKVIDRCTIGFIVLYGLAASAVGLHRFWQYEVFYYDFGMFDQAIWNISRLAPPIIDHTAIGGRLIFADHFSPTIFLLSPLFWFTNRPEMLLIVQAVAVAVSGLVLYVIGKALLKNNSLAGAVTVAYLLFIGVQNALINDFHDVTVMTLPLMLIFLSIIRGWRRRFWLCLVLVLGLKESAFLIGLGVGIFLLTQRSWRRTALVTILVAAFWGFMTTRVIIPYFSGGVYLSMPILPPWWEIPMRLVDTPTKVHTIIASFGSFLFLPLLYPPLLPLILLDFVARFVPINTIAALDLSLHYNVQIAPMLAVASLYAIRSIIKRIHGQWMPIGLGCLLIATTVYLHQFKFHGPLGLSYNPAFYAHTHDFAFLDTLISHVPANASVMTQNNLAVRFSHQKVWLFRNDYRLYSPDYVVLDLRDGQNPNDFYPQSKETLMAILGGISQDPNYETVYKTDKQFVFRKKRRD